MKAVIMIVALMVLVGCETAEDIRALPPLATANFQGNVAAAARCTEDRLRHGHAVWDLVRYDEPGGARLTAFYQSALVRTLAGWELTFRETASERFQVEIRSLKTIMGSGQYPPESLQVVAECSAGPA
jgi:hypothetical protein